MSNLQESNTYASIQNMMTVKQVAEAAGVTGGRIRQLILAGDLVCVKIAGAWFIDPESAAKWIASDRKPGPKAKGVGDE